MLSAHSQELRSIPHQFIPNSRMLPEPRQNMPVLDARNIIRLVLLPLLLK